MLEFLLSAMPEKYNYDYFVFSASNDFSEEKEIWESDFYEVIKRFMFKKFDNAVERNYMEYLKSKRDK